MLKDKRHFALAHFQYGAGAMTASSGVTEARIEKSGIVHAELADEGIERYHFRGIVGWDLHGLGGGEDIKLVGVENQAPVIARGDRLPKIGNVVRGAALDLDNRGVALGAIADYTVAVRIPPPERSTLTATPSPITASARSMSRSRTCTVVDLETNASSSTVRRRNRI